jgi:tetratricopeptide (TPR) repeat protein
MEKAIDTLIAQAPSVIITIAIITLIIFVLKEYRKVREETDASVRELVNARLGEIMANLQSDIARLELVSKDQEGKIKSIDTSFRKFEEDISAKAEAVNQLYQEASSKLTKLREAIPDVHEFSAQDILGIAQARDESQARAELCKQILEHPDATSTELELAGDMMRDAKRYNLAIQLYTAAHEKDPEKITAYVELLSLTAEIDYQHREKSLKAAMEIAIEKPNGTTFRRVCNALIELNRYMDLAEFSDRFIQTLGDRSPSLKALALRNKAVSFKEIGDIEQSIVAFNEAFFLVPEDENILKPYLGLLEEQGKRDEYTKLSRKLIDIDPSDISYYRIYIAALIKQGLYSEASEWIERTEEIPKTQYDDSMLKQYARKVRAAANNAMQPTSVPLRSTESADG